MYMNFVAILVQKERVVLNVTIIHCDSVATNAVIIPTLRSAPVNKYASTLLCDKRSISYKQIQI